MQKRSPPSAVIVLAVLTILVGIFFVAGGGDFLMFGIRQGDPILGFMGVLVLLFGISAIIVGDGFRKGTPGSRKRGVLIAAVIGILSVLQVDVSSSISVSVNIISRGSLIGVAISLVMIYYLTRYDVEVYLSRDSIISDGRLSRSNP
jgi:hypothetical protein